MPALCGFLGRLWGRAGGRPDVGFPTWSPRSRLSAGKASDAPPRSFFPLCGCRLCSLGRPHFGLEDGWQLGARTPESCRARYVRQ